MALPPPPAGLDLSEDRTPDIEGALISTLILALGAIVVRFYCRWIKRAPIWWDDWMIVVAFLTGGTLTLATLAWMVPHGLGRHIWVAPSDAREVWAKSLLVSNVAYTLSLVATKYSLLLFYWRIFKQSSIRMPIYILFGIVTCWGIAVVLVSLFQCFPLRGFWERFDPNVSLEVKASFKCPIVQRNFYIANAIPNILTDIAIIVLPIPYIWRLSMDRPQKFAISSIFLLSAFIVGISFARFAFIFQVDVTAPDITWNFIDSQLWTAVEQHVAIICACLPSMKPVLTLFFKREKSASMLPLSDTPPSSELAYRRKSSNHEQKGFANPYYDA